jgi:hypothetical protein
MLVQGHSGFGIELLRGVIIRKSAGAPQAARLERQIEKQDQFWRAFPRGGMIETPRILRRMRGPESFRADMEFVAAKDFIQFLSEAHRVALDDFMKIIADYIRGNLASSKTMDVSIPMRDKLAELAERGVASRYVRAAKKMCKDPIQVPVGRCHGDLTLSNILFKQDRLYFLDFLDCYIESPLQDIVKLRQDTYFGWSLQLYQADFDETKVRLALRYLDRLIEKEFGRSEWYRTNYRLFQFVSLMRILPYCTEEKMTRLVTDALDQLSMNS